MDLQRILKAVHKLRDAQRALFFLAEKKKRGCVLYFVIDDFRMSDGFDDITRALIDSIVTAQLDASVKAAEANLRKVMEEELRVPGDVAGGAQTH